MNDGRRDDYFNNNADRSIDRVVVVVVVF